MRFEKKLIIILFLLSMETAKGHGEPVSRYRFYDTYRKIEAEKELDWKIRQARSENLRLEFEANRPRFNSSDFGDYLDYLNKSESHFMNLLNRQTEELSAPYLSHKALCDISDGFQKQARGISAYYDEKKREYYHYLDELDKFSLRRFFGFLVEVTVTTFTAGTAAPTLVGLQVVKFGADGIIESACGFGSEAQRAFNFMYGFGMSTYAALQGFENASKLWDNGHKFAAGIEYAQSSNELFNPLTNELARENPDSFIGRGLPGVMAGLNLCSNVASTANVPEGRYLSKSSWKYPESVFRIGSAVNDIITIDYAIRGNESWAATHPDSSFYLQQGCRSTDAAQTVIATHSGTKEFNKATDLKLAQGYVAASIIDAKPIFERVDNDGVVTKSLTCQELRSSYIDSPRKVPSSLLKNPYQFAKLRYERAGKFLQEYVDQARVDNPIAAVANPFLFTYDGSSSYSNYEDSFSYLDSIFLTNRDESRNYGQNNSYSLTNFHTEASTNYIFPGCNFSVSTTKDGITYKDYLNTGVGSEFTLGKFWEYRSGTVWTDGKFKLGRANHSESFSLDWGNKFANADPKAFSLIEGLKVTGPEGEIWEVDMIGGPRNIDGTFSNGKSQGFWSGGLDRHGQILPKGSGVLVDTKHQNYFVQLSKGFAPERIYWNNNFTSDWGSNYLFNQLNQPARNFFEDFGSPFLEDFTPQTIAQKYDPWLQDYTVYGGGVEQTQDALGRYQTINRLDYAIERLGKVKDVNGEVCPAMVEGGTVRGGKIGEYTYVSSLGDQVEGVYVHDVRSGENIIYTSFSKEDISAFDLYKGEYRKDGLDRKVYGEPLRDLYGKREESLSLARSEMGNHIRSTAILSCADGLTIENVNHRDFESLGEVKKIIRDRLIPAQKTIKDVIKMQSYIDNGNDWSNWDFGDERGNLGNANELLTTARDVTKEENILKGYRTAPWTADVLKNSETKIISNFQVIESGGNLRRERLSLRETEGWETKAIFALDSLGETRLLHPSDGEIARENIGRLNDRLGEKVEYDHTYFPSERIFCLQKIAPAATALVGYAGLKLESRSIRVGTGLLQLAQGRVPTGLSALFSPKRVPVIGIFGPRVGRSIYDLYGKTTVQKISYSDLAGGVLSLGAAAVSGYRLGTEISAMIKEPIFSRPWFDRLSVVAFKGSHTVATIGGKANPSLLLLPVACVGWDMGLERLTNDPIAIDTARELIYREYFQSEGVK